MVGMSGSVFSEQILADKLSKLNSTQQCIETLSHWCIFHRSKAELVVTTWDKQFRESDMSQKVPLLYLANDILQNSKRKGNEFVDEFWKVLPGALKDVLEKDDDRGKNVVSRLVGIWEERRVFRSRSKSLRDLMLGGEAPPLPLDLSKKRSRSVRIVRRDSRSIKTKLTIGSSVEKIVSAFHVVLSEHPHEDVEMSNCKSAVHRVRKMEKDIDVACLNSNDPKREKLAKELEGEETNLKQCVEKLKSVEESRAFLVSQLREALHEQESQLENVRTQMQVALAQAQEVEIMRRRLTDESYIHKPVTSAFQDNGTSLQEVRTLRKTAASIAAEVADKLAASTSSQLIMTSVLSSFAAEEAKNAGFTKSSPSTETPIILAPSPAVNHSYSPTIIPPQAVPTHIPTSQPLYQILPNHPTQPYVQPAGPAMASYGFVNFPTSHGLPPPPQMASPLVTAPPGFQQMAPNQTLTLAQPAVPIPPQPPFRPLQPPQMVYHTVNTKLSDKLFRCPVIQDSFGAVVNRRDN